MDVFNINLKLSLLNHDDENFDNDFRNIACPLVDSRTTTTSNDGTYEDTLTVKLDCPIPEHIYGLDISYESDLCFSDKQGCKKFMEKMKKYISADRVVSTIDMLVIRAYETRPELGSWEYDKTIEFQDNAYSYKLTLGGHNCLPKIKFNLHDSKKIYRSIYLGAVEGFDDLPWQLMNLIYEAKFIIDYKEIKFICRDLIKLYRDDSIYGEDYEVKEYYHPVCRRYSFENPTDSVKNLSILEVSTRIQ